MPLIALFLDPNAYLLFLFACLGSASCMGLAVTLLPGILPTNAAMERRSLSLLSPIQTASALFTSEVENTIYYTWYIYNRGLVKWRRYRVRADGVLTSSSGL